MADLCALSAQAVAAPGVIPARENREARVAAAVLRIGGCDQGGADMTVLRDRLPFGRAVAGLDLGAVRRGGRIDMGLRPI